jgi:hypothetical protein
MRRLWRTFGRKCVADFLANPNEHRGHCLAEPFTINQLRTAAKITRGGGVVHPLCEISFEHQQICALHWICLGPHKIDGRRSVSMRLCCVRGCLHIERPNRVVSRKRALITMSRVDRHGFAFATKVLHTSSFRCETLPDDCGNFHPRQRAFC